MPTPWKNRRPQPITVKRRFKLRGVLYHEMSDGSIRNPEHPRHERKELGLSPRQHRKLRKALRRGEEMPEPLRTAA
jgi:hypothetical protein